MGQIKVFFLIISSFFASLSFASQRPCALDISILEEERNAALTRRCVEEKVCTPETKGKKYFSVLRYFISEFRNEFILTGDYALYLHCLNHESITETECHFLFKTVKSLDFILSDSISIERTNFSDRGIEVNLNHLGTDLKFNQAYSTSLNMKQKLLQSFKVSSPKNLLKNYKRIFSSLGFDQKLKAMMKIKLLEKIIKLKKRQID